MTRLVCKPGKADGKLIFSYQFTNDSSDVVYVVEAMPELDKKSKKLKPDKDFLVTICGDDGMAIVARTIPPSPAKRALAGPFLPLVSRLAPGASVQRQIAAPLPWAESSPYFPDLPLRQYEAVAVTSTTFAVGFWRASIPGLVAAQSTYAPEFFQFSCPDPAAALQYAHLRFPTSGLEILRRLDDFPRSINLG
jgi:hypothetical protein